MSIYIFNTLKDLLLVSTGFNNNSELKSDVYSLIIMFIY